MNSVTHVPYFDVLEESIQGASEEETSMNYKRFFGIRRKKMSSKKSKMNMKDAFSMLLMSKEQEKVIRRKESGHQVQATKSEREYDDHMTEGANPFYENVQEYDIKPELNTPSEILSDKHLREVIKSDYLSRNLCLTHRSASILLVCTK